MNESRSLGEWVREVCEQRRACPSPAEIHRLAIDDLGETRGEQVRVHLDSCARCRAEYRVAMAFEDTSREQPAAAARIIAGLEERFSPSSSGSREDGEQRAGWAARTVEWFRRAGYVPAWRLAAAALLVAVALLVAWPHPPALPDAQPTLLRGTIVRPISPRGTIALAPEQLRWHPHAGAAEYRVRVLGVDDTVIWQGETQAASLAVPTQVAHRLRERVLYRWTVEALALDGAVLASSGTESFRIVPDHAPPQNEKP